jgi:hypothetical protein
MSENAGVLVWLHGDSLSLHDPAACAFPDATRVFVFDRPFLEKLRPSFKRLFFLHECAEELADEIRLGEPVEELLEACRARGLGRIAVTRSHAPRFCEVVDRLRDVVAVDLYDPVELVSVPDEYVPRRFGEFWRKFGEEWH